MTISEMHYDFKKKLNKVDSNKNRNLLIPEIDWALNEALEIFVKMVAEPRVAVHLGFEKNQRIIDDIRTLVTNQVIPVQNNIIPLPEDYMFYLRTQVVIYKEPCGSKGIQLTIRQHDDTFEDSVYDKSSFEWGVVNGLFNENGIIVFDDGTFTIDECILSYIKKHPYINFCEGMPQGTYGLPSGVVLTVNQDCILPEHTHREIVDIAVALVSGELQAGDFQIKYSKLNFNELK